MDNPSLFYFPGNSAESPIRNLTQSTLLLGFMRNHEKSRNLFQGCSLFLILKSCDFAVIQTLIDDKLFTVNQVNPLVKTFQRLCTLHHLLAVNCINIVDSFAVERNAIDIGYNHHVYRFRF